MPSQRRVRVALIAIVAIVFLFFYYSVQLPCPAYPALPPQKFRPRPSNVLSRVGHAVPTRIKSHRITSTLTNTSQGEASKIQNQDFYKTTLKAMRAKEDAKNAKPQQPIIHPGADADTERPAVPVAKGGKSEADSEMEEISIAGRTKMTVPKMKDPNAVQAAVQVEKDEEVVPVVDHTEAKSELNDILKRSPSMFSPPQCCD